MVSTSEVTGFGGIAQGSVKKPKILFQCKLITFLEVYPWKNKFPNGAKVCDLGGGNGHVLLELLKTHPDIQGVLQDLPTVIDGSKRVNFLSIQFSDIASYVGAIVLGGENAGSRSE
jgi:hypothetical protein